MYIYAIPLHVWFGVPDLVVHRHHIHVRSYLTQAYILSQHCLILFLGCHRASLMLAQQFNTLVHRCHHLIKVFIVGLVWFFL